MLYGKYSKWLATATRIYKLAENLDQDSYYNFDFLFCRSYPSVSLANIWLKRYVWQATVTVTKLYTFSEPT